MLQTCGCYGFSIGATDLLQGLQALQKFPEFADDCRYLWGM